MQAVLSRGTKLPLLKKNYRDSDIMTSEHSEEHSFSSRIIHLLSSIPEGRVASYGQIAALAGNPRGSRAVVWLLRSSSRKYNLPWHRVVNSKGVISTGSETQKKLLESEGVEVIDFTVNMNRFRWKADHHLLDEQA